MAKALKPGDENRALDDLAVAVNAMPFRHPVRIAMNVYLEARGTLVNAGYRWERNRKGRKNG